MTINSNYVLVERIVEPKVEGFQKVEVQDSFVYKGRVVAVPDKPVFVDNLRLGVGSTVLFVKYSPDTQELNEDGKKQKFVHERDLLACL